MKQIDDNQLRIVQYLSDQTSGNKDDLLPLISFKEDQIQAYLAAVAKLKTTGIIDTTDKNGTISYSLTSYGQSQFE